jgi:hypothetical protein
MDFLTGFPPSALSQKGTINPLLQGHVDLALKRLKLISRRLLMTLTAFEEESRILDRLFYKGKNQHRTSMFWRHAEEMQMLCRRIHVIDLWARVNQLRHLFYNSTNYRK